VQRVRRGFWSLIPIAVLVVARIAWSSPVADNARFIPLENTRTEATDIVVGGKNLLPSELAALRNRGSDISKLDPDPTTDLWRPAGFPATDEVAVRDGDAVRFVDWIESPVGRYRLLVQKAMPDGTVRLFQVLFSPRLQTYLLRRNLLRRMGYRVPAMKRLNRLTVQFASSDVRNFMVSDVMKGLRLAVGGDKEWIMNLTDQSATTWETQDVVVAQASDDIVNLAHGVIRDDLTQGRRLINALIVPFNLVDIETSINGLRWHSVRQVQNALFFPLDEDEDFSATMADARWAFRRIQPLRRADWEQIVSGLGYCAPAEKLLVEKLISRRNELRRLLNVEGDDVPFDTKVTLGQELVAGDLRIETCPGLATRVALDEAKSLISGGELGWLLTSQGIGTAISEAAARFNAEHLPRTFLAKIAAEKNLDAFLDDVIEFLRTGQRPAREVKFWSTPYYNSQIILSRNVVAGSYMGADNRVQLVDTVGVAVEGGMYVGSIGLPTQQMLEAQGKVYAVRTYSHLKPLVSIKSAVTEDYRNLFVPLFQKKWADLIQPKDLARQKDESDEDYEKRLDVAVKALTDGLANGESLIISDNLGTEAAVRAGYRFDKTWNANVGLSAGMVALSRFHIQRSGNRIQIYKDLGNMKHLQLVASLRAKVEVLSLKWKASRGSARTEFYDLNLNTSLAENPGLPAALVSLKDVFLKGSVGRFSAVVPPYRLRHQVKESQNRVQLLAWNRFGLNAEDRLELRRPGEDASEFYFRRIMGARSGADYQSLGVDVVNAIIAENSKDPVRVSSTVSPDPGETLFGKSFSRFAQFEAEVSPGEFFKEVFVGITYRWRGWQGSRKSLEKIIKEFSGRFEYQFFHSEALQQVKSAELYTVNLRVFIYQEGLWNLVYQPLQDMAALFKDHLAHADLFADPSVERRRLIVAFSRLQKQFQYCLEKKDLNCAGDKSVRLASLVESSLDSKGLIKAVGGVKNLLVQPVIVGFFKGEDGKYSERPIDGSEIGEYGSARRFGPMTSTQLELGMNESSFYLYWMMARP
jgi:hypothetical protein